MQPQSEDIVAIEAALAKRRKYNEQKREIKHTPGGVWRFRAGFHRTTHGEAMYYSRPTLDSVSPRKK